MRKKRFLAACAAVLFVLCFTVIGMGAENPPILNKVADVSIGSHGIYWQPGMNYARITLTVSYPDGQVFHKTFAAGTSPYFSLSDIEGQVKSGSYTYELVVSPVMEKRTRKPEDMVLAGLKRDRLTGRETFIQTGYFTVKGGSIVTPGIQESGPARPLDEVIYDDLIVDGSLCVGNDCYSGLAFGFDTIVLMENNLRIYFDDTSNTSSFPNNDWRIVINDTTDGGGEYFAIQDVSGGLTPFTIEAGAKTNSLYVDDDGQVGIGTSGPVFELHIKEGDTPCVRLHQSTAYGWPEQIWDVGGNETSFFVRDGTHAARLPFRIEPETPTSTLCLKADGKVGIGTWSPAFLMELEATGEHATFVCERTSGAQAQISARSDKAMIGARSNHPLNLCADNDAKMTIATNGYVGISDTTPDYPLDMGTIAPGAYCTTTGVWHDSSSLEYKENIRDLTVEEALAAFDQLNPVRYNYKVDKEDEYVGFIAEHVPELVASKDRKGMSSMNVVAVLTKVLQEQQKTVAQQQKTVAEQQKIIAELQQKIAELEKK